jgi:hypothetical protein
MFGSSLAWVHSANNLCAIRNALFRVKRSLLQWKKKKKKKKKEEKKKE